MIFESKKASIQCPDISFYDFVFAKNERIDLNRPCYINAENHLEVFTYRKVIEIILKFAAGIKLVFPDFKKGDVVAFYATNEMTYAAAIHGPPIVGGTSGVIPSYTSPDQAADCLRIIRPKILIACIETINNALEAAKMIGLSECNVFVFGAETIKGACSFDDTFLSHDELAVPIEYTSEELATMPYYLCFTSGTTGGKRKAVTITQKNLCSIMLARDDNVLLASSHVLSISDFHYVSTLFITFSGYPFRGFTTYLLKNHTVPKVFLAVQQYKIKVLCTVTRNIMLMLRETNATKYDLSSLEFVAVGGAATDKSTCLQFYKRFKVPVVNTYGMTEVIGPFEPNFETSLAGEVGPLTAGYKCKLIDNDGNEVGYNTVGELYIKGPSVTLKTAEAFDEEGYFRTGDLFKMTEHGSAIFVERANDIIKFKHFHIDPLSIESVLASHPLVDDCAAVGIYSKSLGVWLPTAFVKFTNLTDHAQIKNELLGLIEAKLPDEMQLRGGLYIVENIPRNPTGKIERQVLRSFNNCGTLCL
ncbi:uncharacterized protein B0P05DRAFT_522865 [Gilbertella persicaria]|uniref:uncharacterized protein n=1 Tax=Gilbertella persicaria TaxID=101096 RepID=UPI00221F8A0C|nr:uncharacterized protein B0P05DRAFT_522865 [Gilbertella persicaria]KAI8097987.1 hypothetical protein B0P05DRAFT_522865 [Gilbertella persicaria]